ncbi:hypothetical protein L540_08215 [Bordetella pseudohinzii]|uniref:Uncharacterized protein n=2 Tax=Bordetella pseudohinzii TaxID=1331258 RepID=A0ABM6DKN4_9BORD|nr:hypothetical protein BBN53_20965 [Bordetella pseudohinzii]KMM24100.1 hypothetical protein L540_08215 [Bordetella pseudohinzii]
MNMRQFRLLSLVMLASVAGCAWDNPPTQSVDVDIDQQILEASRKIQAAQANLYQAGVMARQPMTYAGPDTTQLITLSWAGDALQLLAKLAHDHRLAFAFTGVRLPLPVRIDVQNATIESVLAQLRAQVGYRAQIVEQGDTLMLQYNPPRS